MRSGGFRFGRQRMLWLKRVWSMTLSGGSDRADEGIPGVVQRSAAIRAVVQLEAVARVVVQQVAAIRVIVQQVAATRTVVQRSAATRTEVQQEIGRASCRER